MNTYIVGMPGPSGTFEKTVQADYIQFEPNSEAIDFYIQKGKNKNDEIDEFVASFNWGQGMYIIKKDADGRTNSASA